MIKGSSKKTRIDPASIGNRDQYIQAELVASFFELLSRNLFFMPGFILLTTWFIWMLQPKVLVLIWGALCVLVILIGFLPIMRAYEKQRDLKPPEVWARKGTLWSTLSAAIAGFLPWVIFEDLATEVVIVLTIGFALVPTIVVSYSSGYLPNWIGTSLGVMLPLLFYTVLKWDFNQSLGNVVSTWMVLYTIFIYSLARSQHMRLKTFYGMQWDLAKAMGTAERALEIKNQFLTSASHDIRQPIDALGLLMDVLKQQIDTRQVSDTLQKIDRNINAQKSIYDVLLSVSKLDSEKIDLHFAQLNLSELFEALNAEFMPQATQKNLDIEFSVFESTQVVFTDRYMCESILRNLISNAIKYTLEGQIYIYTEKHGKKVKINVRDTGIGIADEELKSIFKPFYRIESGTLDNIKGLGLGLSIVDRMSELINGEISVESEPAKGSMFSLSLPGAGAKA